MSNYTHYHWRWQGRKVSQTFMLIHVDHSYCMQWVTFKYTLGWSWAPTSIHNNLQLVKILAIDLAFKKVTIKIASPSKEVIGQNPVLSQAIPGQSGWLVSTLVYTCSMCKPRGGCARSLIMQVCHKNCSTPTQPTSTRWVVYKFIR